ncbi:hypothetical protein [Mycobacterium sp.]|uniref:hypothetical protein n=1 Tax=Mycobacterium sp. TaxID=1785 RepID=UPI003BACA08F
MKRPASWKVLTIGAAMTGLGFLSAATALADDPRPSPVDTSNETIVAPNGGDVPQEDGRVLGLLCRHLGTC